MGVRRYSVSLDVCRKTRAVLLDIEEFNDPSITVVSMSSRNYYGKSTGLLDPLPYLAGMMEQMNHCALLPL